MCSIVKERDFIEITNSVGSPFGAIGTGYGVYGKYGFVHPNFNSTPNKEMYNNILALKNYDYLDVHDEFRQNFVSVNLEINGDNYALQGVKLNNTTEKVADEFRSFSFLPFAKHTLKYNALSLDAEVFSYSPLIPYDLPDEYNGYL